MDVIEQLHRTLDARATPEAVCALIAQVDGTPYLPVQRRLIARAADSRPARYSSMSDDFERPVPAEHKVRKLVELLAREGIGPSAVPEEAIAQVAGDPWQLLGQLRYVAPFVGWHPGGDYAARLNRDQRERVGVGLSKRKYNRLVRHMIRTQDRAKRLQQEILLRQLTLVGRSGLAYSITADEMRADPVAACFVAYWVAQRNRRRAFTTAGRDNPYDGIADLLLLACTARAERTDWWMLARAYPSPVIVARLDDERRGELMGHWFGFMRVAADMLRDLHEAWPTRKTEPDGAATMKVVDRATMIVQPGVDSSTWNTVAQAYNAARAGWLNCVGAAGALDLLDAACPGKAMRLMAADLGALHASSGGGVDPDTKVWAALPPPWEILDGTALCGAPEVDAVCRDNGVDPHAKGWTAPRQIGGDVAEWEPTPELVHGIEVADPLWAGLLRRCGAFSGKAATWRAGDAVMAYVAEQQAAGGQQ